MEDWTVVTFGGSALFDASVPTDRVYDATMLAFLGNNLTTCPKMLNVDPENELWRRLYHDDDFYE